MKRKVIAGILSVMMGMTLMTGCGGGVATQGTTAEPAVESNALTAEEAEAAAVESTVIPSDESVTGEIAAKGDDSLMKTVSTFMAEHGRPVGDLIVDLEVPVPDELSEEEGAELDRAMRAYTPSVDSLLVKKAQKYPQIYSQYEKEKSAYLIIVPSDGYYSVNGNKSVYLKSGLNYLKSKDEGTLSIKPDSRPVIPVDFGDVTLSGTAEIRECAGRNCICGIDSNSGSARFNYSAAKDGLYALTVTYSNNEEGGVHAYNVDLIEEYITIESGSGKYELWCVNTMSGSSFNTAVVYIELTRGDNIITLSNDGHNKFGGRVATSPCISGLSVCPAEVIYG